MITLLKSHQNCCQQRPHFKVKYPQNSISAGTLPHTPLGELTALPRLPSWILGALLLREGRGGKERVGRGREKSNGGDKKGKGGREGSEGGRKGEGRVVTTNFLGPELNTLKT